MSDSGINGYIKHSLATAVSDFLVASGAGVFVKKTLAEVKTLLDWAADIATHAGLTTGVHGVGAGTVAKTSDITGTKLDALTAPDDGTKLDVSTSLHGLAPKAVAPAAGLLNVYGIANAETAITNKALFDSTNPAALGTAAPGTQVIAARRDHVHLDPVPTHAALVTGVHGAGSKTLIHTLLFTPVDGEIFRQVGFTAVAPFTALINGPPTTTSVAYDGDANEGSVIGIQSGALYWGRLLLYNSTRATYRKIISVNTSTNTITTEASFDTWNNNDAITTQSQMLASSEEPYVNIDVSANIPAGATFIHIFAQFDDAAGTAGGSTRNLYFHPYQTYDNGNRFWIPVALANETATLSFIMPVVSQKICWYVRNPSTLMDMIVTCKGYM